MLKKVKQGFETNKDRFTLIKVWGSKRLRARA
jgi:ribosomal protein S17E